MFIEIIKKFTEIKPLFFLATAAFLRDHTIKDDGAVSSDDVPGDNFPYVVMNR